MKYVKIIGKIIGNGNQSGTKVAITKVLKTSYWVDCFPKLSFFTIMAIDTYCLSLQNMPFILRKMSYRNWKEWYSEPDLWLETNVAALGTIGIFFKSIFEDHARNLLSERTLSVTTFDTVTDELLLMHHLTRIGKALNNKATKKNGNVAVLHGLGPRPLLCDSSLPITFLTPVSLLKSLL